jgi:sensor domain CHASE-containing protein
LEWEKSEMQQVAERVAGIKAREMKVVEKRLNLEQAQLDAESQPQGMPDDLRKFM